MARKLREQREAAGLNQRELAEKAHIPQSSLSDLERGTRKPWKNVAVKLSNALSIPINILFPEDFI